MVIKFVKIRKEFLACPGYPECRNAKPIIEEIDVPMSKMWSKSTNKKN